MFDNFGDILSIGDLCKALRIGRNSAYILLNSGRIRGFRIGSVWKVPKTELIKFVSGESGTELKEAMEFDKV